VLRAAGVSPIAEPLVLRTAVGLVWQEERLTGSEARLLLGEIGSDAHREAGTWPRLVRAALEGPADDPAVPELARDLLRRFGHDLASRERGALRLLEFAQELDEGSAEPGWVRQASALRSIAKPVEPAVLERAFGVLARKLLDPGRPDAELQALILGGDAGLIAAYAEAARSEPVRDRLRVLPSYLAACFATWSSHPHASTAWHEAAAGLLDEVLRPIVRALPDADLDAAERHLTRAGGRWTEEFAAFRRRQPGALRRLGRRLPRRGRRDSADGSAGPPRGDVEPPERRGRS
jgi:hypothetical protein